MPTNVENLESRPLKSNGGKPVKLFVYGIYKNDGTLLCYRPAKKELVETTNVKRVKEISDDWGFEKTNYMLGVYFYKKAGRDERRKRYLERRKIRIENRKNLKNKRLEKRKSIKEEIRGVNERISNLRKIVSLYNEREKFLKKFKPSIMALNNGKMLGSKSAVRRIEVSKQRKKFLKNKISKIKLRRQNKA